MGVASCFPEARDAQIQPPQPPPPPQSRTFNESSKFLVAASGHGCYLCAAAAVEGGGALQGIGLGFAWEAEREVDARSAGGRNPFYTFSSKHGE